MISRMQIQSIIKFGTANAIHTYSKDNDILARVNIEINTPHTLHF